MPIIRITNRKRPKNAKNRLEKQQRHAAQARWLAHGDAATHEERLGLVDPEKAATPSPAADDAS